MFSYILLFLSSIPFLYPDSNLKLENKIYIIIITSGLFSYSILGLISLGLIHLDSSRFPIRIISFLIFLLTILFTKDSLKIYSTIKNFLLLEFIKFQNNFRVLNQKKFLFLIVILLILITLSSIGPINHPDSLDYHVGYPYQYWLQGKFFIDGGLTQALMGAGDYAHLAFVQEKTIWLIRYLQISNLPIISLFFINNIKNKLYIIGFLTSSTFIQWSTIGKPLFLGESSCAIAYILWRQSKDNLSRRLLLICMISCISIKISSLIVCTPIFIDIFIETFLNKRNDLQNKISILKNILFDRSILLSITLLLFILYTRFKIIGNFAYPLLTNIFNKNDILIKNFTEFISGYQRDGLFPLNIFLPISFSDIASSLGPGIFLIILLLIINTLKENYKKTNTLFYVCLTQIILLIMFCQGRADYYAMPLIISIYYADNLNLFFRKNLLKISLNISIFIQLVLIIGYLLFSINQNILSILDYEKTMIQSSYGFDFSRLINRENPGGFYQNVIRDVKFFYPKNYISEESMNRCIQNNKQTYCLKKYDITQIISEPNFLLDKSDFSCSKKIFMSGARNPLNRGEIEVESCEKISSSE